MARKPRNFVRKLKRFFFFKQKTAYELGLGIPAEPLFRSVASLPLIITSILSFISGRLATKSNQIKQLIRNGRSRSEERRVGKECRSGWGMKEQKELAAIRAMGEHAVLIGETLMRR